MRDHVPQLNDRGHIVTTSPTSAAFIVLAVVIITGLVYLGFFQQWMFRGLWGYPFVGFLAMCVVSFGGGFAAFYAMPWREFVFDVDRRVVRVSWIWLTCFRWGTFEIPFIDIAIIEPVTSGEGDGWVSMRLRNGKRYVVKHAHDDRYSSIARGLDELVTKFR